MIDSSAQKFDKDKETVTITDCFEECKKPELLDEDNKWYCSKCKEHVQATKTLEIFRAPPIFVINLKRFKQTGKTRSVFGFSMGGMFGGGGGWDQAVKDDTLVDFPLDGLDLTEYIVSDSKIMSPNNESMIYDCYAVSNHMGCTGGGHYTAYARNPLNNKWYEFDDASVGEISEAHLK